MDFEEFFRWNYPIDIIDNLHEKSYNEMETELNCFLNDCKKITPTILKSYIEKLPYARRELFIDLCRILTGVSRTNFIIFFTWHLVNKKIINIIISPDPKYKYNIRFSYNSQKYTNTVKNFSDLLDFSDIRLNFYEYFQKKEILQIFSLLKNKPIFISQHLKQLIKFDNRGPDATLRGKTAEKLFKKLLIEYGLEQNIDFNSTDIDTIKILIKKLKNQIKIYPNSKKSINKNIDYIKKKVYKEKFYREADIVLTLDDPVLIIQSSFYNSDTASLAEATTEQNTLEKKFIDLTNETITKNKILYLGLIDGVGFHSIGSKRYAGLLNSVDDYFGLRTIPTKFRKSLHTAEKLFPIDFEVILFLNGGKLNPEQLIKKTSSFYKLSKQSVKNDFEVFSKRNKFNLFQNMIHLKSERISIAEKYALLDLAYLHIPSNSSGNYELPGKMFKISDLQSEIIKYSLVRKIDVSQIICDLVKDMVIIPR